MTLPRLHTTPMNTATEAFIPPTVHSPKPRTDIVLSIDSFYGDQPARRSDLEAMRAALEACRARKAAKLILPKRIYRFDGPKMASATAHIELENFSDLTIDGQGSEFIFHHIKTGFRIRNCQRVLIKNFAADWDFPLASPGVMELQPDGAVAIRIAEDFPLQPGRKLATSVTHYDTANRRWIRAPQGEAYYPVDVRQIGPQLITSPTFQKPPAFPNGCGALVHGMPVCVRHYVYDTEGFINFDGKGNCDLSFEDITVYQCPGHTFVGYGCDRGFRISHCRIERRPGSKNLVSATADGAHFGATVGDIIIEHCDFSHMGDDSVNIHGTWLSVVEQPGARTLRLTSRWFNYSLRLEADDEIKLCRKENLLEFWRARIVSSDLDFTNKIATITVDSDLPENIAIGDCLGNDSRASARFLIRNNFFHDHRARGMLIQARGGLVENNHIRNTMACGLMLTTDSHQWNEGYGCEDLIVRDNLIEGCNYVSWERGPLGRHMACVSLIAEVPTGIGDAPVHRNVTFERNTIRDTPGLALLVASSEGVVIKDNVIIDANTEPFDHTGEAIDAKAEGTIMVTRASCVTITGNKRVGSRTAHRKGIHIDARNTDCVTIEGNEGFE